MGRLNEKVLPFPLLRFPSKLVLPGLRQSAWQLSIRFRALAQNMGNCKTGSRCPNTPVLGLRYGGWILPFPVYVQQRPQELLDESVE